MKTFWRILIVGCVLAALTAAGLYVSHYRAKSALEAYRKQLLDRGEKLNILEFVPPMVREDDNAARDITSIAGTLTTLTNPPPMMRPLAPGRALVGWAEPVLTTHESTNIWPEVEQAVEEHRADLARMRAALDKPSLRFPIGYASGYSTMLPHLAPLRRAGIWFAAAAMLDLHEGRATNALADLESIAILVRQDRGEPFDVSQRVRIAVNNMGVTAGWEALQYPGWRPEQLARLQHAWESSDLLDGLEPALGMERALSCDFIDQLRNSFNTYGSVVAGSRGASNLKELWEGMLDGYPRYALWKSRWSYEEELEGLQLGQAGLETARSLRTNAALVPALENLETTFTNIARIHPAAAKRFLANRGLGRNQRAETTDFIIKIAQAETARRLLVAAIALKRHQLEHGRYPDELRGLVPAYLAAVPRDPMDGQPLRYHANADGTYTLYSVGDDGKDDGGDPKQPSEDGAAPQGRFVNFSESRGRTYWLNQRDVVWPRPATAEETRAYEADMIASYRPPSDHRLKAGHGEAPQPVSTNQAAPAGK